MVFNGLEVWGLRFWGFSGLESRGLGFRGLGFRVERSKEDWCLGVTPEIPNIT